MFKSMLIGATLIVLPITAFAQPGNNGGGNGGCGVGQQTNGCGGVNNGGAGGAGGSATAGAAAAAAASARANAAAIAAQQQQQRQRQSQTATGTGGTGVGGTGVGGSAVSGAQSSSSGQTVNVGGDNYNVPAIASTATAPGFALGNCGWAISGGFQAFIAGASGGTAGVYDICLKMQAADHFRKNGNHAQAKAVECLNTDLRKAHYEAGEPCRADMPKQSTTAPVQVSAAPVNANAWCTAPLQIHTLPDGRVSCY